MKNTFGYVCTFTFALPLAAAHQTLSAAEINTATTLPVATSTVEAGAPGDLTITDGGSITLDASPGATAVLVDSDNSLSHEGDITITDSDAATGIAVQGGRTTSIYSNGTITIDENYERVDTDGDGDRDGSLAIGTSRTGILVESTAPLVSDINLDTASNILIEGNASAGVRIQSQLQGSLVNDGTIVVVGNETVGVELQSGATGNVVQSGSITAQGTGATGIQITDAVDGAFLNEGGVTTTGFFSTTLTNYADPESITGGVTPIADRIDIENLSDGGPAVSIGGSIAEGFLNNGPIDRFIDAQEAADETKDTIEDFDENRGPGAISTFGSAPAVVISADLDAGGVGDLVIGKVVESVRDTLDDDADGDSDEILATFDYDYGFINRGAIVSNGLNVGFDSTALQIEGVGDGSRLAIIEGGIQNTNTISAEAFEADAVGVAIGPFAQVERITNSGAITAKVTTDTNNQATAILIDVDSTVNDIVNTGTISAIATTTGPNGSAAGISDLSGTLLTISNQGTIAATLESDPNDFESGTSVAIDLSNHGAAASTSIQQTRLTPTDDLNRDGVVDTADVLEPAIIGDILLGGGDDTIDIQAGFVSATRVDFGAGVDQLQLSDGASFSANIVNLESVTLDNATLQLGSLETVALDQLTVTGTSELFIDVDLQNATISEPRLVVSGAAVFDAESTITTTLEGFVNEDLALNVIEAGTLTLNTDASQVAIHTPAIYNRTLEIDDTNLRVLLRPKTAAELGLGANEANIFDAVLDLAAQSSDVGTGLSSFTDDESLVAAYLQLVPDYSNAAALFMANELSLATGPTGARLGRLRRVDEGLWFDLSMSVLDQDDTPAAVGYDALGVSFQLGLDRTLSDNLVSGISLGLRDGGYELNKVSEHQVDFTAVDIGVYASYGMDAWSVMATGAVGSLSNYSDRTVVLGDLREEYEGEWDGLYYSASAKLAYEARIGKFFIKPSITADYFSLDQDGYTETSDSAGANLALTVDDAESDRLSGTFLLNLGHVKGRFLKARGDSRESATVRPVSLGGAATIKQIYVGYRSGLSSTAYSTKVGLSGGSGDNVDISNPVENEDAILFGFNVTKATDGSIITLGYAGEIADDSASHRIRVEFKIPF